MGEVPTDIKLQTLVQQMINGQALKEGAKASIVQICLEQNIHSFEDSFGSVWLLHKGRKNYYVKRSLIRHLKKEIGFLHNKACQARAAGN
jgi:hypothetical protein